MSKSSLKSSKVIDLHIKKRVIPFNVVPQWHFVSLAVASTLTHFPSCPLCSHLPAAQQLPLPISSSAPGLELDDDDDNHWSRYRRLKRGILAQRGGVVEDRSTEPPTRPVRDGGGGSAEFMLTTQRTSDGAGVPAQHIVGKYWICHQPRWPGRGEPEGWGGGVLGGWTVVMCCKSSVEKSHQLWALF